MDGAECEGLTDVASDETPCDRGGGANVAELASFIARMAAFGTGRLSLAFTDTFGAKGEAPAVFIASRAAPFEAKFSKSTRGAKAEEAESEAEDDTPPAAPGLFALPWERGRDLPLLADASAEAGPPPMPMKPSSAAMPANGSWISTLLCLLLPPTPSCELLREAEKPLFSPIGPGAGGEEGEDTSCSGQKEVKSSRVLLPFFSKKGEDTEAPAAISGAAEGAGRGAEAELLA
mmetsp:Transcript_30165/g.59196  ORF Transcript_30165/g.59196 Transcript_30165/m.59196 type:complete len:233 (-) Transcript_30165:1418-2116(-)